MSKDSKEIQMKIISLGLGVQSTAMYLMSSLGEIDRADYAVFADPGLEHPETYQLLNFLKKWLVKNNGIPIISKQKSLYKDLLNQQNSTGQRFSSIPAFTESEDGGGMLRRQCTKEYKIDVVVKAVRELYGLKPRKRMPMTEFWLGITLDEIMRMKDSRLPRVKNIYPLIEKGLRRSDCLKWLNDNKFPQPIKSACAFCPYQSDSQWKRLKQKHPNLFKKAVNVDNTIRDSTKKGIKQRAYLHRSLTPLDQVDFESQLDLFDSSCDGGYCGL
jgi:hypothetical protein|tara:strand:- start:498 stop:1313 length:816 start_codon:yes stop_codon:yes gene_type:complete